MFGGYFPLDAVLMYSVVTFGGVGIALVYGLRRFDVDLWAAARGLELTPETCPMVTRRLQLGRRIRTIGFAAGWCVPYVGLWVRRDMRSADGLFGAVDGIAFAIGYLVAALVAELWLSRSTTTSGVALLEPRTVDAYVPRWARVTPWIAAAGALALAVAYATLPRRDSGFGPSVPAYLGIALTVVAAAVALEVLQRLVVSRRQSFSSTAMTEADDALRSATMNILAGIAIGFAGWVGFLLLWNLGTRTDVQFLRWTVPLIGFVLPFLGLKAFAILSSPIHQWRVRRSRTVAKPA
jgi:hypothetical protein